MGSFIERIKMLINVFSKVGAEEESRRLKGRGNWISIRDVEKQNTLGYSVAGNVLELFFDDVTPYIVECDIMHPYYKDRMKERALIYFDESMARKILEFSNNVFEQQGSLAIMNIHCWAGKSRSQAIAESLNIFYNLVRENRPAHYARNIRHNFDNFIGNTHVFKIMNQQLISANLDYFK